MGKLLCDSTATVAESPKRLLWQDPIPDSLDKLRPIDLTLTNDGERNEDDDAWETVSGLEQQQKRNLQRLHAKGVLWKHPEDSKSCSSRSVVFHLTHGGQVSSDGNCLFSSTEKAMGSVVNGKELRRRTVKRFLEEFRSASANERSVINDAIRHMYSPDLRSGWGVHVVQDIKLLAKKEDREALDSSIDELLQFGMQREFAAESVYKESCIAVEDGESWAKYMAVSGSPDDKHHIITLQYTEDGLLSVDENRQGHAAAFGDDTAIECLATEFKREIYVVQAHGSDTMADEENCVFFLPHRPRSKICEPPIFLFMKGTGWCGAGGDHYEPMIAHPSAPSLTEKVAFVL